MTAALSPGRLRWWLVPPLAATLFFSVAACSLLGSSTFTPGLEVDPDTVRWIIMEFRLPRVFAALLVGAGLAAAGCTMQGMLRNPLADPYILGTSAGGAVGAGISIVFLKGSFLPIAAFIGAGAATAVVYGIGRSAGRATVETILLAGIAVSIMLSAVLSFLMFMAGESLHRIVFWLMGGFWTVSWSSVRVGLLILPAAAILILLSRELNILALGEEEAAHLGVRVEVLKVSSLGLSAFMTGIAVSIAGAIGFIGLITPHLVRLAAGPDHRFLIPASMALGGLLLLWSDTLVRTFGGEMPVGIVTALLGGPFFIALIRRRSRV